MLSCQNKGKKIYIYITDITVLQYDYLIILHAMLCVSSTYCTLAKNYEGLGDQMFPVVKITGYCTLQFIRTTSNRMASRQAMF